MTSQYEPQMKSTAPRARLFTSTHTHRLFGLAVAEVVPLTKGHYQAFAVVAEIRERVIIKLTRADRRPQKPWPTRTCRHGILRKVIDRRDDGDKTPSRRSRDLNRLFRAYLTHGNGALVDYCSKLPNKVAQHWPPSQPTFSNPGRTSLRTTTPRQQTKMNNSYRAPAQIGERKIHAFFDFFDHARTFSIGLFRQVIERRTSFNLVTKQDGQWRNWDQHACCMSAIRSSFLTTLL